MSLFKGCATAIVTPFTSDGKSIDYESMKKLIDYQINSKVSALVVMGTTGESATLTHQEKIDLAKFVIEYVGHRVPVILGSGTNNTESTISLSCEFESLGADGLLVVTPYYNKCTQQGAKEHYLALASRVGIPIILYNVPSRTGFNLLPQTVKELAQIENIVGIKEASGNISQIAELFSVCPSGFDIYSGDDNLFYTFLAYGGSGVISVASNIVPDLVNGIYEHFCEGRPRLSCRLQLNLLPFINTLFSEVNPIPIKQMLNEEGFGVGIPRLPLVPMSEQNKEKMKEEYKKLQRFR